MKTAGEYEAEIARLHAFTLVLAEHLAAASEVLGVVAERKAKRSVTPPDDGKEKLNRHGTAPPQR